MTTRLDLLKVFGVEFKRVSGDVKTASGCGCDGHKEMPERPDYLERHQWIPEYQQQRVISRTWRPAMKRAGLRSEPTLRWFRYTPEAGCAGEYLPPPRSEIWIALGLSAEETLNTFLHECKHAALWQDGDPVTRMGRNDAWAEYQCNVFALIHTTELIRDGILE